MTIAAGFIHSGGIILCSDTQQEGGAIKFHGPKIGCFKCPGGNVAIALAGNVRFAISAIQKCEFHLATVSAKDTISELEAVLEREYRRVVYDHPDYGKPGKEESLGYELLISYWQKSSSTTSLFITHDHVMESCFERVQAIGSGMELATVLARPFAYALLGEEQALILAAYVLARVKANVPGCGGDSQFVTMRNDGTGSMVAQLKLDRIAEIAAAYDKSAHTLLFAMTSDDDEEFTQAVDGFILQAKLIRYSWLDVRRATPTGQSVALWTTPDLISPPASQE
jgi:hypothetical protein